MSQRHTARAAVTKTVHIQPVRKPAVESQIDRLIRARKNVAQMINNGEERLLPLLKRFNTDLEALEEKQYLLRQAAEIANDAAPIRAA